MTNMKRNLFLLWLRDFFFSIAGTLAAASVIQGFLLHYGVSEDHISFYVAFGTVVTFAASVLFSGATARVKKTTRVLSVCMGIQAVCTALYTIFVAKQFAEQTFFVLLLVVAGISTVAASIKTIFEYKLPCEVIDLDKYGMYISVSGIMSGLIGIFVGILITFLYNKGDFGTVSVGVFFASAAAMVAAAVINGLLRVIHEVPVTEKTRNSFAALMTLFKDKTFLILLVPNFVRSTGSALMGLTALIAVGNGLLSDTECAIIATLTAASTMAANVLYLPMTKLLKRPGTALAGALAFCLVFPAFLSGSKIVFFICFTVAMTGQIITGNAIPDLIYQNVPSDIISPFNTWRMILLNMGSAAATAVFGILLKWQVPTAVLLIVGAAGFLVCSVTYWLYFRNSEKVVLKNAAND